MTKFKEGDVVEIISTENTIESHFGYHEGMRRVGELFIVSYVIETKSLYDPEKEILKVCSSRGWSWHPSDLKLIARDGVSVKDGKVVEEKTYEDKILDDIINTQEKFHLQADKIQHLIHETASLKGWWDGGSRNKAEAIALMHSELTEALEYLRKGEGKDDKIPTHSGVEAELADVIIRIFDFAQGFGYDVVSAITAKMRYNLGREKKHGKEF